MERFFTCVQPCLGHAHAFRLLEDCLIHMADAAPLKEVFRKDYQPTPYQPEHVDLKFELSDNDKSTIVCKVRYAPKKSDASAVEADLVLHGEAKPAAMELVSVSLNSNPLSADDYCLTEGLLTVPGRMLGSSSFDLEVVTKLDPASNTELSGLYKTGGIFCTQVYGSLSPEV